MPYSMTAEFLPFTHLLRLILSNLIIFSKDSSSISRKWDVVILRFKTN